MPKGKKKRQRRLDPSSDAAAAQLQRPTPLAPPTAGPLPVASGSAMASRKIDLHGHTQSEAISAVRRALCAAPPHSSLELVTGGAMARADLLQLHLGAAASGLSNRAARVEGAAGGQVARAGYRALEQDARGTEQAVVEEGVHRRGRLGRYRRDIGEISGQG